MEAAVAKKQQLLGWIHTQGGLHSIRTLPGNRGWGEGYHSKQDPLWDATQPTGPILITTLQGRRSNRGGMIFQVCREDWQVVPSPQTLLVFGCLCGARLFP